jgi:hypothetical protein
MHEKTHGCAGPSLARGFNARYASGSPFMSYSGMNRRGPARLRDGDRRQCPHCNGEIEFRERYLVTTDGQRATPAPEPAWICLTLSCGYREFVRREARVNPS